MSGFESFITSNYEIKNAGNPRGVRINCPFCSDTSFHGYVDLKHDFFKCFKCNWSHKPDGTATTGYWFLRKAHAYSHQEVLDILKTDHHLPLVMDDGFPPDVQESIINLLEEEKIEEELPTIKVKLPDSTVLTPYATSIMGRRAWNYWETRMGSEAAESAYVYKVLYSTKGKYKGRIIVPVYEGNKLVWFQGRAYFPVGLEPKYLNPKISAKATFGLNHIEEGEDIIICEGIFDAMVVGNGAVCVFGTTITRRQMERILEKDPKSITVCLDPDDAGVKGTRTICEYLKHHGGYDNIYYVIGLPSDPGDLGPDVRRLIQERKLSYKHSPDLFME